MVFLCLIVLIIIILTEKNRVVVKVRILIIICCIIFFMSNRVIIIYVWLEISIFFILLILLGYGAQVEKISAIYYLVFYSVLCRMPLLWLVLEEDIVSRVVYFGFEDYVSYPTLLLISRPFFMKLPLYFFHV